MLNILRNIFIKKYCKVVTNYRRMSVFTKKMNVITGETDWVLQNEDYDFHQEISRSAFADMLHDRERNDKYFVAIKSAIDQMKQGGKKAIVLDIGTGTGLLSMMAARCGADYIFACEAFSPIAKCAVEVIKNNGFSDSIKVISKRSTELVVGPNGDIPFKANILVAEVFDTELIGEGALPTFSHAAKTLLEEDCIVVPAFGTIYAQVIEGEFFQYWNKLGRIECKPGQFINLPEKFETCEGQNTVHDLQLNQLDPSLFKAISEPQPVLRFDWSGKTIPLRKMRQTFVPVEAIQSGTAQAMFMWWDLTMDRAGSIVLSCAPWWAHSDKPTNPSQIPWRDHWLQAIYYFPKPLEVKAGEQFELVSSHDEYSLWFHVTSSSNQLKSEGLLYSCPECQCGFNMVSRTRIGMLNDPVRKRKYQQVLSRIVNPESVIVTFGDNCFLGLQAALFGAKKVYCVEEQKLFQHIIKDFVKHNNLSEKVSILESPTLEKQIISEVNLILAEPYFQSAVLPWEVLRFWYLLKQFNQPNVMPQAITLYALPLQLDELYKIRQPVHSVHDFKITFFDHLIEKSSQISDSEVETQPLWEYPGIALSTPKQITTFDLTSPFPSDITTTKGQIIFENSGICNGIALWLDFNLDEKTVISQGPTAAVTPGKYVKWDVYTRQGIYFLTQCPKVDTPSSLNFKVSFNPGTGEISFRFQVDKTN